MAELTASRVIHTKRQPLGQHFLVSGEVEVTTSAGHVPKGVLGGSHIIAILGLVNLSDAPGAVTTRGVRNSNDGTEDTLNGALYLDAEATETVGFTLLMKP